MSVKAPIYVTTKELMEILKVSRDSVVRWRAEGMPYEKISRTVRFNLENVLKWIEENTARKRVMFSNKEKADQFAELSKMIAENTMDFYEYLIEMIDRAKNAINNNKNLLEVKEIKVKHKEAKEAFKNISFDFNKEGIKDSNEKLMIMNNNLFFIFSELDIVFNDALIIMVLESLNFFHNTDLNMLQEDQRLTLLRSTSQKIMSFNRTYEMIQSFNKFCHE